VVVLAVGHDKEGLVTAHLQLPRHAKVQDDSLQSPPMIDIDSVVGAQEQKLMRLLFCVH
jgi:hypothetical protein